MPPTPSGNWTDDVVEYLRTPTQARNESDPDWIEYATEYPGSQAHPNQAEVRRRESVRREWAKVLRGEAWFADSIAYDLATWARRPHEYTPSEIDQLTAAITAYLAAL